MLRAKPLKKTVIETASVAAPTGGLNAKDAIANMPETDATIMTNWFPTPSSVDVRNGYQAHKTGYANPVETLMTYNIGSTSQLFAASGASIFNATSAGTAGTSVVSGLSNAKFQWAQMATSGGYFLLLVNGADKMRIYDGTNWHADGGSSYTVTGLDTATAININVFKNRVWFLKNNSLDAYYLGVSSISGTATKYAMGPLFKLGGYLMAMENWTIDNVAGIDDYLAFITSEGEVAIFQGTDPSSANTWALKGTFRMGRPIGRRCAIKVAADVLMITQDGAFPLSKALLTDRSQQQGAITDKITNLFKSDLSSFSTNYGWQPILYPTGNKLIINVPTIQGSEAHQYVMNTIHGAWCKFTGWNAICFAVLGDDLYFGGETAIYLADTGQTDNGDDIITDVQQAFSYFQSKGRTKKFTMARPIFITDGEVLPAIVMNTDFGNRTPTASPSFSTPGGSEWNSAVWNEADWTTTGALQAKWQSVTGVGHSGGLRVKTTTSDIYVKWISTDFAFEKGGVL